MDMTTSLSVPSIKKHALVLFSGGQDSTTCLAWALHHYDRVETIGFSYGQRHSAELEARPSILRQLRQMIPAWDKKLGEDHLCDLSLLSQLSETAMTEDIEIQMMANGLPNTFVPGRNLMFLTTAAILAYRRGINILVGGMCETDFSGYPDCRDDAIKALQVALNIGMDTRLNLVTPLMWKNKQQTWELAEELGGKALVDLVINQTHTCYTGDHTHLNSWGYGCGECPACQLRKRGFEAFQKKKEQSRNR